MSARVVEATPTPERSVRRDAEVESLESSSSVRVEGPGAERRRELQRLADGSPRAGGLAKLQRLADTSARVRTQRRVQSLAGGALDAPLQATLAGGSGPGRSSPMPGEGVGAAAGSDRGGLPGPLRGRMERAFGASFSDVTVRTNSSRAGSRGALALTQGSAIDFAPGQFRPDSPAGQALIGHELTHVLQQRAGRVSRAQSKAARSPLEQRLDIDHDEACEREADELGARAARGQSVRVAGAPAEPGPGGAGSGPIQPKLGFELEMLVLIDKAGRPVPEKTDVGKFGNYVHLDVDQGPEVATITPALPEDSGFDITGNFAGSYYFAKEKLVENKLTHKFEKKTEKEYTFDTVDQAIADKEFWGVFVSKCLKPVVAQYMGLVRDVDLEPDTRAEARGKQDFGELFDIVGEIVEERQAQARTKLLETHKETDKAFKTKYARAHRELANPHMRKSLRPVLEGTVAKLGELGNKQLRRDLVQAYLSTTFKSTDTGDPVTARRAAGGEPGMGGTRYASIVELVTDAHEPETGMGRAKIFKSLAEAAELAALIEGANPRDSRVRLNTLSGKFTGVDDSYYIGNPRSKRQTTDASIQSTFAVDLAQLASYIKSTMDPEVQRTFRSKHDADSANVERTAMVFRAEQEIMAAVDDATAILNDASFVGTPDLPNLRGLLILTCQYLRLGKYSYDKDLEHWNLDKNMTALLSRTDLAKIRKNMPFAERQWIRTNRAELESKILARTGRDSGSTVLTDISQTQVYDPGAVTVGVFVNNVLSKDADGLTSEFGGFRQLDAEEIHPAGSQLGARSKLGPVFELRNIVPSTGTSERFPYSKWELIGGIIAGVLYNLHRRTDAQAMTDVKIESFLSETEESASWKT